MKATFKKRLIERGSRGAYDLQGVLYHEYGFKIGSLSATYINLLDYAGDPWDVLSAKSADATDILEMLPRRLPDWWESFLVLEHMEIHPECRGEDRGIWFLQRCLERFSDESTFVGLRAWPIGESPERPEAILASQKIANLWKQAGFRRSGPNGLMSIHPMRHW